MARKSWDEYFMDIAFVVAERSTCDRLHVGAVLVKNKRIKATGYNGSPSGLPHCDEVGCLVVDNHCVRTIHAEENCLMEADPIDKDGATLYVTHAPCPECQKRIISNGIVRVVYANEYTPSINWFKEAPWIEVVHLQRNADADQEIDK